MKKNVCTKNKLYFLVSSSIITEIRKSRIIMRKVMLINFNDQKVIMNNVQLFS